MRHDRLTDPHGRRLRPERSTLRQLTLATLCVGALAAGCSGASEGFVAQGGGQTDEPAPTGPEGLGGDGLAVHDGEIVARVTLQAPEEQRFLLRATLPVPPGTVLEDRAEQALAVVGRNRETVPSQVNVVARYPDPADGASVVEVVGLVERPPKSKPGQRLSYHVAHLPNQPGTMSFAKKVRDLLGTPGALTLAADDVFGNRYEADLFRPVLEKGGSASQPRAGQLLTEYRTHSVMLPVQPSGGAQGTLPHLLGVHAYVTTYDRAPFFSLDLHVHNGLDGLDKGDPRDDALREVYFRALELSLPKGWRMAALFDHPSLGDGYAAGARNVFPLVRDRGDGKLHFVPKIGRFARRLVVYQEGHKAEAEAVLRQRHLAFCVDGVSPSGVRLWSWWNPDTARWFPQAHRLPDLSFVDLDAVRADLAGRLAQREAQLAAGAAGSYPLQSPALGWAQPWGVPYGGMTGGDEINIVDGLRTAATGSREGYLYAALVSRAYLERQPNALFGLDGEPTKYEDMLVLEGAGAPYVNCAFYIVPSDSSDPFGFHEAPTFQTEAVLAADLAPPYQADLDAWMPIDIQHYIRLTRNLKILAWLGNDTLAVDQLAAAAEVYRLGYHAYPNSQWGYVQPGLLSTIQHVSEFPGQGLDFQRSEGWGLDCAVAAFTLGDAELRGRFAPWFETVAEVVEEGASTCTGNVMATPVGKLLDGKAYVRLVGHSSYADNALRGMAESVFRGRDDARAERLRQLVAGNAQALIGPGFWNDQAGEPYTYVGVGLVDELGDFCTQIPDWAQSDTTTGGLYHSSFAYAFETTGEEEFLFRAAQMLGGGNLKSLLEARGLDGIEGHSALLALVQEPPQE